MRGKSSPVFVSAVAWPVLERLLIHVIEDPSARLVGCPALVEAPLLSHFSTSYATNSILSRLPQTHRILTVELFTRSNPGFMEATINLFMHVIALFPLLESLTIALDDIIDPPLTSIPTTLPFMRTLYLTSSHPPSVSSWNPMWQTSMIWSYITAPRLQELSTPQRWFEMGPIVELNTFFERNGSIPAAIKFVECSPHLVERWRLRQQQAWPHSIVKVKQMVFTSWYTGSSSGGWYSGYCSGWRDMLSSNNNLNLNRYLRLMLLAGTNICLAIPLGIWVLWVNVKVTTRWLTVAASLLFFAFFGFADEAMKNYRSAFNSVVKGVGYSTATMSSGQLSSTGLMSVASIVACFNQVEQSSLEREAVKSAFDSGFGELKMGT
ncbi:hypothetical protein C8R45DRAFT_1155950 [Mycena sanguinolenta]|nr:hypothetical protein C8R45DRAFT_1155950 [Mycena sanguinolenta]